MDAQIAQFQEVCNVDAAVARRFVEHANGDIDSAIALFFHTGGSLDNDEENDDNFENERRELRQRRPAAPSSSAPVAVSRPTGQSLPVQTWTEWLYGWVLFPLRLCASFLWELLSVFSALWTSSKPAAVKDAAGDVRRFCEQYNALLHDVDQPLELYNAPYSQAIAEAKKELRLLVIVLVDGVQKRRQFLTHVLNQSPVTTLLRSSDFLVWACSTTEPEGQHAAYVLRASKEPFVGLYVIKGSQLFMAMRAEGSSAEDASRLYLSLEQAINSAMPHLRQLRRERHVAVESSRLRAEQEREYAASVAADQARARERQRHETERAEQERIEMEAEKERLDRLNLMQQRRESLAHLLDPEKNDESGEIRVAIRYPSGAHHERRFSASHQLQDLWCTVFAHEACPFNFSLYTRPRQLLEIAPEWYVAVYADAKGQDATTTFSSKQLLHSLVVFVEDNDA